MTSGSGGRRDAGGAALHLSLLVSSGRHEPSNGLAVEELSCPAEKLNSDAEGEPLPLNGHPEAPRNHWPTLTHPARLSAALPRLRPNAGGHRLRNSLGIRHDRVYEPYAAQNRQLVAQNENL